MGRCEWAYADQDKGLRCTSKPSSLEQHEQEERTSAADTVQVRVHAIALGVGGLRHVVVDNDVDALDVDAARRQVRRDEDARLVRVLLELLHDRLPLRHLHAAVQHDAGEARVLQQPAEDVGSLRRLDEDHHLQLAPG